MALASRAGLIFVLLATVLLLIVGVLSYRGERDNLESAAMTEMLGNAIEKDAQVDAWIEERLSEIRLIAQQAAVVEKAANLVAADRGSESAGAARALLIGELEPHLGGDPSHFSAFLVMDPEHGRVVASTSPAEEGTLVAGQPYFDKGKTDLYRQTPYYSTEIAGPAMTAAVPLRATDGRVVAVLAARVDLAAVNVIVRRRTGHDTQDAYLVNAEQYLVTQPRFMNDPEALHRKIDSEAVRRLVGGNNGVFLAADYRGVPSISAYCWNAQHEFGVIVKMDRAEAIAPAGAFGRSVVLIGGLVLLAAAGLAIRLARSITANEVLRVENAERKRTEESARAREYALSESQRLGHIGSWFYDMTGNISWSEEMYRLCGVSPDTFIPSIESLLSTIVPDDRPAMQAWVAACAAGEAPGALEYRVNMPDGTIRFMRGYGEGVYGPTNQLVHMAGTMQDVTPDKLAELERERFVALIENSADFIGMATLEGQPFFLNTAGREMVGLDRPVSSTNIADFSDADTGALLQNTAIPATFASGHWTGEGSLRHFQTHALIPVHIHSILVRNRENGEPICLATVQRNITDIKEAEKKLEHANRELLGVTRLAGMAEVATSVLHNVGNVLNSVNVSADRISEKVKRLKPASLEKVAALLRAHAHDLPEFLARDPQGKELPAYLAALIEQLADPQKDILPELVSLKKNVDHIREIVRMQQNFAGGASVLETMALTDLMEDAISINAASLTRHEVKLIREYSPVPKFPIDKHKVLQILVNLLSNSRHALDAAGGRESQLTIRIGMHGSNFVRVTVADNGVGIAPENLTRIFQHGFTTRDGGHGFGLHSGALAAQELGGSLTAESGGPGKGAVFTLELPCCAAEQAA